MPDLRLQRARESLPSGYQFGDAADRETRERWIARCLVEESAKLLVGEKKIRDEIRCR